MNGYGRAALLTGPSAIGRASPVVGDHRAEPKAVRVTHELSVAVVLDGRGGPVPFPVAQQPRPDIGQREHGHVGRHARRRERDRSDTPVTAAGSGGRAARSTARPLNPCKRDQRRSRRRGRRDVEHVDPGVRDAVERLRWMAPMRPVATNAFGERATSRDAGYRARAGGRRDRPPPTAEQCPRVAVDGCRRHGVREVRNRGTERGAASRWTHRWG